MCILLHSRLFSLVVVVEVSPRENIRPCSVLVNGAFTHPLLELSAAPRAGDSPSGLAAPFLAGAAGSRPQHPFPGGPVRSATH